MPIEVTAEDLGVEVPAPAPAEVAGGWRPAGLWRRFGAALLDWLGVLLVTALVLAARARNVEVGDLLASYSPSPIGDQDGLDRYIRAWFVFAVVAAAYFVPIKEWGGAYGRGQTLGKQLCRVRVVSAGGTRASLGQRQARGVLMVTLVIVLELLGLAALNALGDLAGSWNEAWSAVTGLALIVALVPIFTSGTRTSLVDRMCGTVVVDARPLGGGDPVELLRQDASGPGLEIGLQPPSAATGAACIAVVALTVVFVYGSIVTTADKVRAAKILRDPAQQASLKNAAELERLVATCLAAAPTDNPRRCDTRAELGNVGPRFAKFAPGDDDGFYSDVPVGAYDGRVAVFADRDSVALYSYGPGKQLWSSEKIDGEWIHACFEIPTEGGCEGVETW